MQQPGQEQLPAGGEDNQRNENKMNFVSHFIQLFAFYVSWCGMMQRSGCSSLQHPHCHVIADNVRLPVPLRQSKQKEFCVLSLSKYLDWRQSFCFSWHRVSCIEGYLTLLPHLSHTVHNVILRYRGDPALNRFQVNTGSWVCIHPGD